MMLHTSSKARKEKKLVHKYCRDITKLKTTYPPCVELINEQRFSKQFCKEKLTNV